MDVAKAGELIGKVAGGNVGILGRYGIQVRKGATETEALALLQAKFAGQAEAYGNTAAGAQERFAVTIGNVAFDPIAFTGMGLLLGLDTVVSQSFGAGRTRECERWLWQALYLVLSLAPPLMLVIVSLPLVMRLVGVNPEVLAPGTEYLHAMCWSVLPLLVYGSFRRYLQGIGTVRPVMLAILSAQHETQYSRLFRS